MKEELLASMAEIVAREGGDMRDFENCTKAFIEELEYLEYPIIWVLSKSGSNLFLLGAYKAIFYEHESERYAYARGIKPFDCLIEYHRIVGIDHKKFLIDEEGIREISREETIELVSDIVETAVTQWDAQYGPLPKYRPIEVRFNGITLTELRQLLAKDAEEDNGTLLKCLRRFHAWDRRSKSHIVQIYWDRQNHEFSFGEYVDGKGRLYGGIIYHGNPKVGYLQNNAFQLDPSYGWRIHT